MKTSRFPSIVKGGTALAIVIGLAVGFFGCGGPAPATSEVAPDRPLFSGNNGYELSYREFLSRLLVTNRAANGGIVPIDELQWVADSIVVDSLLWLSAATVDIRNHPPQWRDYDRIYGGYLVEQMWERAVRDTISWDTADVRAYWEENQDQFRIEDQVEILHLLLGPRQVALGPDSVAFRGWTREAVTAFTYDMSYYLYRLLQLGFPFPALAQGYSHDVSSRDRGGYLGWSRRGQYVDPFDSIAFALGSGDVSEPFFTAQGWHIIQVLNRIDEQVVPLDTPSVFTAAQNSIVDQRQTEAITAITDSLRSAMRVAVRPVYWDTNLLWVHDTSLVAVVNDRDSIWGMQVKSIEELIRLQSQVANTDSAQKAELFAVAGERLALIQHARDLGIDTLAEVRVAEDVIRRGRIKSVLSLATFDRAYRPTEEEMQAYYEARIDSFRNPQPLNLTELTTGDSALAVFMADQAATGRSLTELLEEFSELDQSLQVTELGWVGRDDLDQLRYGAALGIRVGQVSQPVRIESGRWALIAKNATRLDANYESVRGDISRTLRTTHYRDTFFATRDSLYVRFGIRQQETLSDPIELPPTWEREGPVAGP